MNRCAFAKLAGRWPLLVLLLLLVTDQPVWPLDPQASFPIYLQSPLQFSDLSQARALGLARPRSAGRKLELPVKPDPAPATPVTPGPPVAAPAEPADTPTGCLYDKNYFNQLDQCLSRKPYPTVGLLAFKNEDLVLKRGITERAGCQLVLNNGLFKHFQVNRLSADSDGQCLDSSRVVVSMDFTNVTLAYLWSLRCLNRADQLLDDATLDAQTSVRPDPNSAPKAGLCVGSSQTFGFASLQLNGLESQVEFGLDVYRNWRVTNVTLALLSKPKEPLPADPNNLDEPLIDTSIKDFVFESLDGDELNWRYLQLYHNWARNRMHANFIDQFRRFTWILAQRCLSDASERLPAKPVDVFTTKTYN